MFTSVNTVFTEVSADVENNDTENNSNSNKKNASFSVADELLKFKNLLDMAAITQEDFELKKKQLLYTNN
jgi:hypothetical protein